MAVPTVTTTPTIATPTTTTPTTATSTAGAGIAGSGSSITSAAPTNAPSTGFSATISAWVTSVVDAIRNCLAKIPGIGSFFATTPATTTTPVVTPVVVADVAVANVKGIFDFNADPAATVRPVPANDLVAYALSRFGAIVTDADKVDAYGAVISARNTSPAIARQFYDALPANLQTAVKAKMHIANVVNGNPSSVFNGVDHTVGFGEFMIHHEICNAISQGAVALVHADLVAAATPATTTTTP